MSRSRVRGLRWTFVITAVATICIGTAPIRGARASPYRGAAAVLMEFTARVGDYMAQHDRVAAAVGPLNPSASPADIAAREAAMGRALRVARAGARQGDILIPQAAQVFRAIIRRGLAHRARLPRGERDEAPDERPAFNPRVNQIYPATEPLAMMPPGVLRDLPRLPEPLEYRFVRQHLILRDREANLIVDVLPSAAPPP